MRKNILTLKEIQSIDLDMLYKLDFFCKDKRIKYYLAGGTLLGAIRHKGFIPWDDDIDVGMPRADYEKLYELLGTEIHEKYLLETPKTTNKDYYYTFSKIYDTQTTLVENTKCRIKRGIYLDIFPLDGIGSSQDDARKNYSKIKKLNDILLLKVAGIRKGRKLYKNIGVALFRLVPISSKKILNLVCNECAKRDFDEFEYGGNLVGAWGAKEILPRKVMGTPKLYKFEDIMVYGAEDADAYLTGLYGDWRQLPPVEKRISHHDYILCDLERSYLNED